MAESVLAGSIGQFEERPFAGSAHDSFVAIWRHQLPTGGAVPPIIVIPDGTIDLQWIDGDLRVAGPDREAKEERLPGGTIVIGVRFRPAAAQAWLGVAASELVGQRVALEDLWGAKARRLSGDIRTLASRGSLGAGLESILAGHAVDRPADAAMRAAHAFIERGPPPGVPLVPWLARAVAMSERTLRRRFDDCFGYGPKTLDRILRYQRFLRIARASSSPAAVLAAEAGYADQPHLIRESRHLSGVTPKAHRRLHAGG